MPSLWLKHSPSPPFLYLPGVLIKEDLLTQPHIPSSTASRDFAGSKWLAVTRPLVSQPN